VFALWALAAVVVMWLRSPAWAFGGVGLLFALASYQVLRGRGRWAAWVSAVCSVAGTLEWPGLMLAVAWPLVFLVSECLARLSGDGRSG
jgi:hypothetical protein